MPIRRTTGIDMPFADVVGWGASAILIATLLRQSYLQWTDKDARGVSRWLFVGQILASLGFILYSALVGNWVFIVSNSLILLTAVAGELGLLWRRRRR
jgi:uncharacterized protein with PQ loop repeat